MNKFLQNKLFCENFGKNNGDVAKCDTPYNLKNWIGVFIKVGGFYVMGIPSSFSSEIV